MKKVLLATSAILLMSAGSMASANSVNVGFAAYPLELGAYFSFTGSGGSASGAVYDSQIHSGVFGTITDPNNVSIQSDAYVLQGGDPYGRDTSDNYETAQAQGHINIAGFDIYTNYNYGNPAQADQAGNYIIGSPDTGWVTFTNNSGASWTGVLDLSGQALGGIYGPAQLFDNNSGIITVAAGASINILLNNESSNYGGYNITGVVVQQPTSVPEPATLALMGLGFASLAVRRRKTV